MMLPTSHGKKRTHNEKKQNKRAVYGLYLEAGIACIERKVNGVQYNKTGRYCKMIKAGKSYENNY